VRQRQAPRSAGAEIADIGLVRRAEV
jgi:hypothetical protein